MIKDAIQHNDQLNPNDKQLAILRQHFPGCFSKEGSFDIEKFKTTIADKTNVVEEGYKLRFLGESYAKLLASTETTSVIQPNEAHNSLPENANSQNIYISGDNLDALKHLLKSYNGAIKCIYIDPPYNTGSDGFVYADNFNYTKETLQEKLNVSEEEAERILDLTKRGSASHSAWLMFMYSRLLLARDLLKKDGVIFISIDDNEQANLKLLCDDVFGEENFISNMIWAAGKKNDSHFISNSHEYMICYVRNQELFKERKIKWRVKKEGLSKIYSQADKFLKESSFNYELATNKLKSWFKELAESDPIKRSKHYSSIDENGVYFPDNISWPGGGGPTYDVLHPKTKKSVKVPSRGWIFPTIERMQEFIDKGLVVFGEDENSVPTLKSYLKDREYEVPYSVFYKDGRAATKKLMQIFDGKKVFDNPKDENIIESLIRFISNDNDITVLDFFSGSGTTAHAVMKLNALDDGKRKFISVQLPEVLSPDVDSQKIAFDFLQSNNLPTTLDYVGIERIKRAAAKIKQEHPDKELDLGFKHYTLAEPAQNTLDKLESFTPASMLADDTLLDAFGKPTILATWLCADGYGLTTNPTAIHLDGYTAYHCQKHLYFIEPGFTLEHMKALLQQYESHGHFNPENIVLFGYSFPHWSVNEMLEKNMRILNDSEKNLKINLIVRY
ncbi:MAG: site-specific DNA-methyltransferase [Chitinophagaceae bacterium]|nr:site-specific DNA-methyltransferase [Chitinophagaceae bacterium]